MGADDADGADGCGPASSGDGWLAVEVMYIVRVRARPSFLNSISTPILRRKVAARRSRPDNARGLSGQVLELATRSSTAFARAPRRSDAVPVHTVRVAITARTAAAIGSPSITPSTASSRLPEYADEKVLADHIAVSQAVAHSAKSAIRGNSSRRVSGKRFRPSTTTSSSAPKMYGRTTSNAVHSSASGLRRLSGIGSNVRNNARSARSGRATMSSMPFRIAGRAASNNVGLVGAFAAVRAGDHHKAR